MKRECRRYQHVISFPFQKYSYSKTRGVKWVSTGVTMPCMASCIQQQSTEHIGGKKQNSLIMHTTWQFSCQSEAWGWFGPAFVTWPQQCRIFTLYIDKSEIGKYVNRQKLQSQYYYTLDEHISWNFFKKLLAVLLHFNEFGHLFPFTPRPNCFLVSLKPFGFIDTTALFGMTCFKS